MSVLITIEGVEGAGKSTLRSAIAPIPKRFGLEVVLTREPGGTEFGKALRSILLDPQNEHLDPLAELSLFFADRAQHVAEVIRPALARGAVVVCDRFAHSTFAYQGFGRGLPLERLKALNSFVTGGLEPDLVLLLDLDPKTGLLRARERSIKSAGTAEETGAEALETAGADAARENISDQSWSRFEEQELQFHQRIRHGFLTLAAENSAQFAVLDGALSPAELTKAAAEKVELLLKTRTGAGR